jgi:phage terminase large subunit-like protein
MKGSIPQFPRSVIKGRARLDRPTEYHFPDPTGRAQRVIDFIQQYKLWEGKLAGQTFKLHGFQQNIVRRIYGPSKPDGSRLTRTAAIWIPRGNGKTPLASALGLAHLYGPEAEEGGQIILSAADKGDAGTAFRHCNRMSAQHEWPKKTLRPRENMKELEYHPNNSILKAISMEPYSKHSFNVSFFLCDEIHAWPEVYARDLFGVISDSMAKRTSPLTVVISVAPEGSGGLANEMWEYSVAVARGEIDDPGFAPIFFCAPPDADWQDEQLWYDVNPGLEHGLLSIEEFRSKAKKALRFPADLARFKRYHLNIPAEGVAEPWISPEVYDDQAPMTPVEQLAGRRCWVGVDLSSTEDLTAVVAVFPSGVDTSREYDVLPMFFLPEQGLDKKADQDRADYLRWAEAGFLKTTPGNVIDKKAVVEYICDLAEQYDVAEIVIDPYRAVDVNTPLLEEGFTVIKYGQGFLSMAAPMAEMKRALLSGTFRHGGNPILRMCFANAVAIKDGHENEKLTKGKSRGRIDGAVASAIAIGRILADETTVSVYENAHDRPTGLLVL